jgi:Bacteriophage lambda head decoration protein D
MTIFNEPIHPFEFLVSESDAGVSRDSIVIASGSGVLQAGSVLGKVTTSGKYKLAPATGTDGSQVAVAILGSQVDATLNDVKAVAITCIAQVKKDSLKYDPSVSADTTGAALLSKVADLNKVFIKLR